MFRWNLKNSSICHVFSLVLHAFLLFTYHEQHIFPMKFLYSRTSVHWARTSIHNDNCCLKFTYSVPVAFPSSFGAKSLYIVGLKVFIEWKRLGIRLIGMKNSVTNPQHEISIMNWMPRLLSGSIYCLEC